MAATLLQHLDRARFRPVLALVEKTGELLADVPPDVPVIDLGAGRVRFAPFAILKAIRETKPDVVFSFQGYLNLVVALTRPFISSKIRYICRETNIPSILNAYHTSPRMLHVAYMILYRFFDKIVCQTTYMKEDLIRYAGVNAARVVAIHNPVDVSYIAERSDTGKRVLPLSVYNIVAAGKLQYQKGFDLLLKTYAQILQDSMHLTILGKGPLEKELKHLVKDLRLESKVTFAGFQDDPYPYMAQADLFVLSSRYEGLPNVVLEAGACGTPVVAFSCPAGLDEVIEEGSTGWLAPPEDTVALGRCILRAMGERLDRNMIRQQIKKKFGVEKICSMYESFLLECTGDSRK